MISLAPANKRSERLAMDHKSLDAKRATSLGIIQHLIRILKADHPSCAGVVFEIAPEPGKQLKAPTSKERLFAVHARTAAQLVFKRLDIEYRQPKLSLWDPSLTEERFGLRSHVWASAR
jgi:hypothetical protein